MQRGGFFWIFVWHLVGVVISGLGQQGVERHRVPHAESPGAAPSHL